jgi:hypothetical protein
MGQCTMVQAVFSPGRGETYDLDQQSSAPESLQGDGPQQTVFEYLTPKSLLYLIQRGRYDGFDQKHSPRLSIDRVLVRVRVLSCRMSGGEHSVCCQHCESCCTVLFSNNFVLLRTMKEMVGVVS